MYAYSMAAAHLNLPHKLVSDIFMGCMIPWPKHKLMDPGPSAKAFVDGGADMEHSNGQGGPSSCILPPLKPPPFLHYCQRYAFKGPQSPHFLFFAKRKVSTDVLECDQPDMKLFESDKDERIAGDENWTTVTACAVLRAINYARQQHCRG
mmetsp:Transcript_26235/g.38396  ORF Transcript_26235/g.38396 Transcript_26235/m.38396 type:complete len:150 (+) Transcript_26235:232-681(+)